MSVVSTSTFLASNNLTATPQQMAVVRRVVVGVPIVASILALPLMSIVGAEAGLLAAAVILGWSQLSGL